MWWTFEREEIPGQARDEADQVRDEEKGPSRDFKKSPFYGTLGVNAVTIWAERGVSLAAIANNLPYKALQVQTRLSQRDPGASPG